MTDESSTESEDAAVLPPFGTLQTIEESRENSSLSGESTEESDVNQTESTFDISIYSGEDIVEKSPKVKWIHDVDDEEDDEATTKECRMDFDDDDQKWMIDYPKGTHETDFAHLKNVDRGWAWVVCVALFLLFLINSGLLACTGLYYVRMLDEFGQSRSHTAWLGSLMNAFFMLAGPLSSVIIKKAGCRVSVITGGIVMAAGYLMSAMSNSLGAIFITYGIVVATGMNFVYSGQIITLAQYFYKRHSFATSISMVGVGVGTFLLVRIIDFIISKYGWRFSFIFCAAISLQICVLGAVVFPLALKEDNEENLKIGGSNEKEVAQVNFQENTSVNSPTFSDRYKRRNKFLLNGSVSSLKLSISAGYLSSSFSNLNGDGQSYRSHLDSNHHSFCSRASHYLSSDMRSNQESFPHIHSGEFPLGILPFLRSNQHSFSSRGSFALPGIHSNPQSFAAKNSLNDLYHPTLVHCHTLTEDVETESSEQTSIKEDNTTTLSKQMLLWIKIMEYLCKCIKSWQFEVFKDCCFWLASIAMFFNMFATMKMAIIYKDMSVSLGVVEYYYVSMTGLGIGDIVGRLSTGVLATHHLFDPTLAFSVNILLTGIFIGCHTFATSGVIFVIVTAAFGFLYGQQCVLITLFISPLFGRQLLVTAFGYILFISGLGALFGAPVAGLVVDITGNYNGVILLAVCSCLISCTAMFICFWIHKRRQHKWRDFQEFLA